MNSALRTLAVAVTTISVASACSSGSDSGTKGSSAAPTSTTSAAPPAGAAQLQALLPVPTGVQQAAGPDSIAGNGIHLYYAVKGAPADVVNAYKAALESKGWALTTIVTSTGEPGGGGGATYTGTHGGNYGVFDGGGHGDTTYLTVCAWPTKPDEPNCSRSHQK